ncbi:hypothetical protein SUGI_0085700 [Cryptomeria japonica]|uniref:receptor-like protein 32 n=1 Tax=Cryptomeria japonica TaxID=3369 RepID=UPI002408CFD3|nr:receptor-like protein 32 [Cryptomeria japonica]GLJ08289.1 hypothetical protein SUGI_0085700 [Cryptomeria japonica]
MNALLKEITGFPREMIFLLLIWLSSTRVSVACPLYERNYLLDFMGAVKSDYNSLQSWQGFNCCDWRGVTCSHDLGSHVTGLDLSDFGLQGEIHSSLFKLEYLQDFNLRENFLTKIPSDIGKLRRLTRLDLSRGTWKGEIPRTLGNLRNLRYLDVGVSSDDPDWQRLQTPRFASWLQNLTRLEHLFLNGVNIYPEEASSEWGEVITTLANLTNLELYDCGLSGQLPPSIANLSRLVTLGLGGNYLTGVMPPSLGNLSALDSLNLAGNKLNGTIPSSISKLVRLTSLDLSSNRLSGHISFSSFDNFTRLENMDLSHNRLTVRIDSTWMPNFNSLNSLGLDSCNLVEIPPFLVNQFENRVETE